MKIKYMDTQEVQHEVEVIELHIEVDPYQSETRQVTYNSEKLDNGKIHYMLVDR